MVAAAVLQNRVFGSTVTATGSIATPAWGATRAVIPAASFVAGHEYLILGIAYAEIVSTSQEVAVRILHNSTEFDDGRGLYENNSQSPDTKSPILFMRKFTQPGTTELIALEVGSTGTADVTADLMLIALDLTDVGSGNFYWNENLTDQTTTASFVSGASVTFTPNGTDEYLVIADAAISGGAIDSNHRMRINDSVAGALQTIDVEGEDPVNEIRQYMLGKVYTPTNVSHTLAAQFQHEAAACTVRSSRIFALNLSAFAGKAVNQTAGSQTPATAPTWTTAATASPTPTVTGDWVVLSFLTVDANSISTSTDGLRTRLQINPSGGGLASDPAYGDDAPEQDAWDATDLTPMVIGTVASLTAGAARDIVLGVSQQATVMRVVETTLVAFSAELAGAGGVVHDGAISIDGSAAIVPTGSLLLGGAAAIDGSAQVAQAGGLLLSGAVSIDGSGQVVPGGGILHSGSVSIDGSGQLAAAGALLMGGAIAIDGTGTIVPTGSAIYAGALSIEGAGTIGPSGGLMLAGAVAIDGSGSIVPTGGIITSGAIAIDGSGSLALPGTALYGGAISIDGLGDIGQTPTSTGFVDGAISIDAAGSLTAPGGLLLAGTVSLDGNGALGASGGLLMGAALDIAGSGGVSATGGVIAAGILALSGTGDLGANGSAVLGGAMGVDGSGDVGPNGSIVGEGGSIAIGGVGDLSLFGSVVRGGGLALSGASDVVMGGTLITSGSLSIDGQGSLSIAGGIPIEGVISIEGTGTLSLLGEGSFEPLDPGASGSVTLAGLSGTVSLVEGSVRLAGPTGEVVVHE